MCPQNTPPHSVLDDEDDAESSIVEEESYEILSDPDDGVDPNDDNDFSDSERMDIVVDDCRTLLLKHTESIFCVAVDPTGRFIASGAQDHLGLVWDASSPSPGTVLHTCTGHEDSVISVTFSPDGAFLATGDMAGGVLIWRCPQVGDLISSWTLHRAYSLSDLLWLKWWISPPQQTQKTGSHALVLLAGAEDSCVTAYLVSPQHSSGSSAKTEKPPKYLIGPGSAAVAGEFVPSTHSTDRPFLAVVYGSGDFRVWDLKSEQACLNANLLALSSTGSVCNPEAGGDGDTQPTIFCMATPTQTSSSVSARDIMAVGGVGQIILVPCKPPSDNLPKKIPNSALTRIDIESSGTVETIDFSWTHPFFAYGTVTGDIGIYDISSMHMRQKWTYTDPTYADNSAIGITTLKWSQSKPIFFTATLAGTVVAWSALLREPVPGVVSDAPYQLAIWQGHSETVLDLCLAPLKDEGAQEPGEHPFLVSASDDSTLRIFDINIVNDH